MEPRDQVLHLAVGPLDDLADVQNRSFTQPRPLMGAARTSALDGDSAFATAAEWEWVAPAPRSCRLGRRRNRPGWRTLEAGELSVELSSAALKPFPPGLDDPGVSASCTP